MVALPHLTSGKMVLLPECMKCFLARPIGTISNFRIFLIIALFGNNSEYGAETDDLISVENAGDDYVYPKGPYISEGSFSQTIGSTSMIQQPNPITRSSMLNPPSFTNTVTADAKTAYSHQVNNTSVPLVHTSGLGNFGPGIFNYFVTLPTVTPAAGSVTKGSASDSFSLLPSQLQNHGVPIITTMATSQKATHPKTSKKRSAPIDAFEFLMEEQERDEDEDDQEEEEETTPTGRPKKKKSIVQKERRRERNRVLAKKTRDKKRGHLETLQMEVLALQRENYKLRHLVKSEVVNSEDILQGCNALESVPQSVLEACNEMEKADPEQLFDMATRLKKSQHAFIITDPSLPDNPIVFASGDFLKLTGYDRSHVLGRNCRFLQGPHTSKAKIEAIRTALETGEDVNVTLLNYRADATPFWNQLFIAALRNGNSEIVNYMGVVVEVTGPAPDDPEHGKALPANDATINSVPDADTAAVG